MNVSDRGLWGRLTWAVATFAAFVVCGFGVAPATATAAGDRMFTSANGQISKAAGRCSHGPNYCLPDGHLVEDVNLATPSGCRWTATVNWGDGSRLESKSFGPNQQISMRVEHQYQSPGLYTITLTVRGSPTQAGASCPPSDLQFLAEYPEPVVDAPVPACDDYFVRRGTTLQIPATEGILVNDLGERPLAIRVTRSKFAVKKLKLDRATGSFSFLASAKLSSQGWFEYRLTDVNGTDSTRAARVYLHIYDDDNLPRKTAGRCPDRAEFSSGSFSTGAGVTAATYAPLVWLHWNEKYLPMDADYFVAHSSLKWAHWSTLTSKGNCANFYAATYKPERVDATAYGLLDPWRLGDRADSHGGPYRRAATAPGTDCRVGPSTTDWREVATAGYPFGTWDFTRPYGEDSSRGPLPLRDGWYLDFLDNGQADKASGSAKGGWPVYAEPRGNRFAYWTFYPTSKFVIKSIAPPFRVGLHEGDWEKTEVEFDGTVPEAVWYFAHGKSERVPYESVEKYGKHPVVFAGKYTHASSPELFCGPFCTEAFGDGRRWKTWLNVENIRSKPWYGFGGAWGWAREGTGPLKFRRESTGPLGPSPFKQG